MANDGDVRPIVVVSRCLGFDACRYNGQNIRDGFVEKLGERVEYRTVCPEVAIGLGVPRDPVRIVEEGEYLRLFQPATGRDVTQAMRSFCDEFLSSLEAVDGFILKNRSPSCGPGDVKIYRSAGKEAAARRGSGFFGQAVHDRFGALPLEDEGRLRNFTIREHFLTALFARARFRKMRGRNTMNALVKYHTANKLLFMAYNQAKLRRMGQIVANHDKLPTESVLSHYDAALGELLSKPPRFTAMINVLYHAFGGLSEKLGSEEKRFFLNTVEEYRDERVPLSVLLRIIEAWSLGQGNDYLLDQTLLTPFPRQLVDITDSGKGRKI